MSGAVLGCSFVPNRAEEQVVGQINFVNDNVSATLGTLFDLAGQLASYRVPNLGFSIDLGTLPQYDIRDAGDAPEIDPVEIGDAPAFPNSIGNAVPPQPPRQLVGLPNPPPDAPTPSFEAQPDIYNAAFPTMDPLLTPAVPVYGDLTASIPEPTFRQITLPPDPVIDLSSIKFQGIRPTLTATPPDASSFNYVETPYDPLLVDQLKAKILDMIAGNSGITPIVEFQLWARESERESEQEKRAEQDVFNKWSSRGFSMPVGMINAELERSRQNSQNQRNVRSREVAIRTQDVLIDQLKFAVAQGVALEELWIRVWTSTQDRRLQAARVAVDVEVAVYNALVNALQAEAIVYRTDAEVYSDLINAELAKLQVYSEQIKGRQLIGTLNQQDLDLYLGRLRAVDTNVAIFQSEITARNSVLEGEKIKLDRVRILIEQEQAKLSASELRLRAWTSTLQAEQIKQSAWQTRAQIYTSEMQAWDTGYRADIARMQADIAVIEAETQRYLGLGQMVTQQVAYLKARADVANVANDSKVRLYEAKTQGTAAYNGALVQKMKSTSDAQRDQADLAIKNGEINVQNILEASKQVESALSTAAQVIAQVASGFASAVNVGAHISDSGSSSFSCSTSISQQLDPA